MSKKNKFAGVDDIYFTPKSICVVNVTTVRKGTKTGVLTDRRYYPKTGKNVKSALSVHGYIPNKK